MLKKKKKILFGHYSGLGIPAWPRAFKNTITNEFSNE